VCAGTTTGRKYLAVLHFRSGSINASRTTTEISEPEKLQLEMNKRR
jgi:hypothetical protein